MAFNKGFDQYLIENFIHSESDTYKCIGKISNQLLKIVTDAPNQDKKESHIHQFLDIFLKDYDLTISFSKKVILIYDEAISVEILLALHTWFFTKTGNISNITLVTTHTVGLNTWYDNYTKLMGEQGFNIIEAPWFAYYLSYPNNLIVGCRTAAIISKKSFSKKLNYYFSYFGGRQSSLEKDFLATIAFESKIGYVDYLSGFDLNLQLFDDYLEQLSNFCNRSLIDKLLAIRNVNQKTQTYDIDPLFPDFFKTATVDKDWKIDKQAACRVIRETLNSTPFSIVTEKTLRSFVHSQIPLPLSGVGTIDQLTKLGFKFDHNLIDYDAYQFEPIFFKRVVKLYEQLTNLSICYTLPDLEEYMNDNRELFCYNYEYIISGDVFKNIKENLIKELTK